MRGKIQAHQADGVSNFFALLSFCLRHADPIYLNHLIDRFWLIKNPVLLMTINIFTCYL